jgi:hypothetical protein
MLGLHRYFGGSDSVGSNKKNYYGSGCVTNCYQSMVTTLGLLGPRHEPCKKIFSSAFSP